MEVTTLGPFDVSRICLGTMTFGLQCDEATSFAILDEAVHLGVTMIDTADVYPIGGQLTTAGVTESLLGRWLSARPGLRAQVIVASKFGGHVGPGPHDRGASPKHVRRAVRESLRRLRLDRLDLYQLHRPDPNVPLAETMGALDELVREGLIGAVGVSNVEVAHLETALAASRAGGLVEVATVQPRYNLLDRSLEQDVLPWCREHGVATLVYNPLAGGLLTGKHRGRRILPGSRFTLPGTGGRYRDRYWHDDRLDVVEEVIAVADHVGLTPAAISLAWVLSREVDVVIVGASRAGQLTENLAAPAPDPEVLHRLTDVSASISNNVDSLQQTVLNQSAGGAAAVVPPVARQHQQPDG